MAFRYLIYSTGTTYAETIVRSSAVNDPGVNEASLFTDFVIPEIQPLYLWRVTGGTDVVPNTDQNITEYLSVINPPSPDDYVTYGVYTGFTAQTTSDIAYVSANTVSYTIFNSYTAQTASDLAGKIDIVTGATGNLGVFDVTGNLVDTGVALSGITGNTTDIYVHIGCITSLSTSSSDWKYSKFTWGTTNVLAQAVKLNDAYGNKVVYIDGNTLRAKDAYGNQLFYLDGQTIRSKDAYGEKLYFIDGQSIRSKDAYGQKLYYFDGNTIRSKDAYGEKLYYIDGQTLKYKDAYGSKIYYFINSSNKAFSFNSLI